MCLFCSLYSTVVVELVVELDEFVVVELNPVAVDPVVVDPVVVDLVVVELDESVVVELVVRQLARHALLV